jgi:dTDP-4-dehydrorhamnose reductase
MKLLLFGANGQVGSEIVKQAQAAELDLVACTRTQVDITNQQSVADIIASQQPSIVINAAAYTAVDQAENDQELAYAVNALAPGYIASTCAEAGIPLLHISTDYVFDGNKAGSYKESDAAQPLNCYGRSKLDGENAIRERLAQHIILRTSWVFGAVGNNFIKTIVRLAKEREQLKVVDDQHGCPTPAAGIAGALLVMSKAIDSSDESAWGTYHYCGSPPTTWYSFTQKIVAIAQDYLTLKLQQLLPIPTEQYPTPAPRPRNTVLQCDKIQEQFGLQAPDWEQALHELFESGAIQ